MQFVAPILCAPVRRRRRVDVAAGKPPLARRRRGRDGRAGAGGRLLSARAIPADRRVRIYRRRRSLCSPAPRNGSKRPGSSSLVEGPFRRGRELILVRFGGTASVCSVFWIATFHAGTLPPRRRRWRGGRSGVTATRTLRPARELSSPVGDGVDGESRVRVTKSPGDARTCAPISWSRAWTGPADERRNSASTVN